MVAENIQFTEPRICDCGGDMTKQWYVYFTCTDLVRKETKQFRYKLGINRVKEIRKRKKAAKEAVEAIKDLLYNDGFNPFEKSVQGDKCILLDCLWDMFDIKKLSVRLRSRQTYKHAIDLLSRWMGIKSLSRMEVGDFQKKHAIEFVDWLQKEKSYKGKTVNSTVGDLKAMFYMLVDREICKSNPFTVIKKLKEEEGKNVAFTPYEIEKVLKYMRKVNIRLYYATQFVRYAFIRRTELTGIKVGNINLNSHTITIPADISKNGKHDSVTIPKSLEKIILEMGLNKADPDLYIFGKGLETCKSKLRRVADISDAHRDIIEALDMRRELIFYGWKHTGCVELYNIVKDPYVVCRQCRHSDIKMTMRYLRSLGLGINEAVRDW